MSGESSEPASVHLAAIGDDSSLPHRLDDSTLVVGIPGDELLVLPMTFARTLSRGARDDGLRQRLSAAVDEWRREQYRAGRRIRMTDWLMAYVDELEAARTPYDVCNALLTCAPLVVGGWTADVYATEGGPGAPRLTTLAALRPDLDPPTLPRESTHFSSPVVVSELESRAEAGGPHAVLAPLFRAFGAAQLLCTPVVPGMLIILVERRRDRIFTAEDRDLLEWIVKHARRRLATLPT